MTEIGSRVDHKQTERMAPMEQTGSDLAPYRRPEGDIGYIRELHAMNPETVRAAHQLLFILPPSHYRHIERYLQHKYGKQDTNGKS